MQNWRKKYVLGRSVNATLTAMHGHEVSKLLKYVNKGREPTIYCVYYFSSKPFINIISKAQIYIVHTYRTNFADVFRYLRV